MRCQRPPNIGGWQEGRQEAPRIARASLPQVHPASTYEMNLSRVWSGMGLMESNVLNA